MGFPTKIVASLEKLKITIPVNVYWQKSNYTGLEISVSPCSWNLVQPLGQITKKNSINTYKRILVY